VKYNEKTILDDIEAYIDSTYDQHYSNKGVQVLDLLDASGCLEGFLKGSIIKYISRYGKKNGENEGDLFKAVHLAILLINLKRASEEKAGCYTCQYKYDLPNCLGSKGCVLS